MTMFSYHDLETYATTVASFGGSFFTQQWRRKRSLSWCSITQDLHKSFGKKMHLNVKILLELIYSPDLSIAIFDGFYLHIWSSRCTPKWIILKIPSSSLSTPGNPRFHRDAINSLLGRWQNCVNSNGASSFSFMCRVYHKDIEGGRERDNDHR